MKITSINTYPVSVPQTRPRFSAHELTTAFAVIITEVHTDEGLVGYGQIHGRPMQDICGWVARFAEIVIGMDPLEHGHVWGRLFGLMSPRPGGVRGSLGLPPPLPRGKRAEILAAIGGIDIALWDIKGKAAGMPVYKLLGGTKRPVFTYATGGHYVEGAALCACAEELASFISMGYRAVKLKVGGETMAEEIERVRATRNAIGKEPMLMLDMNAAYDLNDCINFAAAVEPYDITWLEEPLHWYLQPPDFARLAAHTKIPLAHCERELTRFSVRDFITTGEVYFVQFDSTRHGGFTESLRVATLAEQFGVRVAPHQAPELHSHLCMAFPSVSFGVETNGGPEHDPLWYGLYKRRPILKDGHVEVEDAPGFGLEIDWDFVRQHRA
ncbi:MAG: D(-)-tartrate dehydratase [Betaproteobacteria bacterium]|jgi:D-galactarolactone cycloisomerase|nr:D(-)-tartrate dehydratase [Betaproteobacteria bacterium]